MPQLLARWLAHSALPDSSRLRHGSGPLRQFVLELFVSAAIISVAAVFGLCWFLEPSLPEGESAWARQAYLLGRGVIASFVVTALAVVVIARRMRETETSRRRKRST